MEEIIQENENEINWEEEEEEKKEEIFEFPPKYGLIYPDDNIIK